MTTQLYVPVLPYPKRSGLVMCQFGYDIKRDLPYVLMIQEKEWSAGLLDTVWGVEGFVHGDIIILPTALYPHETAARIAIQSIIDVVNW